MAWNAIELQASCYCNFYCNVYMDLDINFSWYLFVSDIKFECTVSFFSTGRFQLIVYREDWARNRLKDRHKGNKMINYLLKQKSDAYDHYCLFYIAVSEEIPLTNSDPPIKVYNFVKIKNGNFQLQLGKNKTNPEFSSLSSFKDKCNLELEGDIELHSITRPELPGRCWFSPLNAWLESFVICSISQTNHCSWKLNKCLNIKICKSLVSKMSNFYPLEVVGRCRKTQLQVGEKR